MTSLVQNTINCSIFKNDNDISCKFLLKGKFTALHSNEIRNENKSVKHSTEKVREL